MARPASSIDGAGSSSGFASAGGGGDRRLPGRARETGRITTLGRGGSDTSAPWRSRRRSTPIAATSTPTSTASTPPIRASCRRPGGIDKVAFEEMLEMASLGAKVLQVRSVESPWCTTSRLCALLLRRPDNHPQARRRDAHLQRGGDCGSKSSPASLSRRRRGSDHPAAQVEDKPGVAAAIFMPLADAKVNVDMIVQNVSEEGKMTDMTFTVPAGGLSTRAYVILEKVKDDDRLFEHHRRHGSRQGLGDRDRHAQPSRRRRARLPRAGRAGREHPRDHNVRDKILAC